MDQKLLFEKTPPVKLFFIAAIPGGISMLFSSIYGILDGVFVGQILGETSFAALNLVFPLVAINFSLADLIGVGSSVMISIHLGQKQKKEADNIFSCACLMIVLTGTLLGAILFATAPAIVHFLGADGELAALGVQYMQVYALCSPITTIVFAMDNYLRICGQIRKSMYLNILMFVLATVFEFIFLAIFRWGIWSAAFATCCAIFVCVVIALFPFFRGQMLLHFCKPHFSVHMIRQIIFDGSPNFLSNIAARITGLILNVVLLRFGGSSAISIYAILTYVEEVVQAFLYGVCDSLQPAVGYNWGAKKFDRIKGIEKCCFIASALISFVSALVMFLFPKQIALLFVKDVSNAFIECTITAMRLFSLVFISRWFVFATQSFMTAIGKSLYASVLSVSTALILPVVLIILLWPLELTGIWLNFPLTYAFAAILAVIVLLRFRKEWNNINTNK